MNMNMKYLNID